MANPDASGPSSSPSSPAQASLRAPGACKPGLAAALGPPNSLSTDFLNRYAEALMLMELAVVDPGVTADLKAWRPISYRAHFEESGLRCAGGASEAYDALDATARGAFEALCSAMDRLVETALLTLQDIPHSADSSPILTIAAQAFRNLLMRAAAFINSGGDMAEASYDTIEVQAAIDRMMTEPAAGAA
jgi:hypothetical protein